jgi:THO complex subunit 7
MIKRFHNYTSLSHTPIVPLLAGAASSSSVEDAREGFLIELATFQLLLKKSVMICEAEARQVEQYQRERERINSEHETLKLQIEELKTALEHAQMLRRRKIEYDLVAEKVNTLPSRAELESAIGSLENDMAAIQAEHDTQNRTIQGQKTALDGIIAELSSLRFMGKETETSLTSSNSRHETPTHDTEVASLPTNTDEEEDIKVLESVTETAPSEGMIEEFDNDIEMGEVEEDPKDKNKKKSREELEEGEATDASSELSDPPDD